MEGTKVVHKRSTPHDPESQVASHDSQRLRPKKKKKKRTKGQLRDL
jgi:hypothetical protein